VLSWLAHNSTDHHTAENIVTQFEEIVSNFESTNKRLFSVAGRVFKPDRCRLTQDLKRCCLSTVTNILNIEHFV